LRQNIQGRTVEGAKHLVIIFSGCPDSATKNQFVKRRLGDFLWGGGSPDRWLGNTLGWYRDSKLDGWAAFFRRLGDKRRYQKCV